VDREHHVVRNWIDFRGSDAAASLKRAASASASVVHARDFRGSDAAASLKRRL